MLTVDSHLVMRAIQFSYCGIVGNRLDAGAPNEFKYVYHDCAPLCLYSSAISFTSLRDHLLEFASPSGWKEKTALTVMTCFLEQESSCWYIDALDFCQSFDSEKGAGMLRCLEGMPLKVVEKIVSRCCRDSTSDIVGGRFLVSLPALFDPSPT